MKLSFGPSWLAMSSCGVHLLAWLMHIIRDRYATCDGHVHVGGYHSTTTSTNMASGDASKRGLAHLLYGAASERLCAYSGCAEAGVL